MPHLPSWRAIATVALSCLASCEAGGVPYWHPEFADPGHLDADERAAFFAYVDAHRSDPLGAPRDSTPTVQCADGSMCPVAEDAGARAAREAASRGEARQRELADSLPFPALAVARMLTLLPFARAHDPALAAKIRRWLAERTGELVASYEVVSPGLVELSPSSLWRRAELRWAQWLVRDWDALDDDGKLAVATGAFPCSGSHPGTLTPAFDRFALGDRVLGDWVRSGRPTGEDASALYRKVLIGPTECPRSWPTRRGFCPSPEDRVKVTAAGWMLYALSAPDGTPRLLHALARDEPDPTLFAAFHDAAGESRWNQLLEWYVDDPRVSGAKAGARRLMAPLELPESSVVDGVAVACRRR